MVYNCPIPPPLTNPSNSERYKLLQYALSEVARPEDYHNIISGLAPPTDITKIAPSGAFKNKKVGIIGGGLAGLASAFELRKLGFDITIFEAQEDRIGGRIYTYYFDKNKNLYGELGAMRIPISHEATWYYINLFNLDTRMFVQNNENAYIYVRDIRVRNDPAGRNIMEEIYPQFNLTPAERNMSVAQMIGNVVSKSLASMSPQVRKEILQVKPFYDPRLLYWDALNIRQVFESMGYSQGAIDLIGSVSPLIGSFFYTSYIEILQEEYSMDFVFLYEILGGTSNLPLAFYNSLNSSTPKEYDIPKEQLGNIKILMGNWVTDISSSEKSNNVIIKYENKRSRKKLLESFDYVICTVPFSTLRTINIDPLFSPEKMQAIKEVTYADSQKTLFLCSQRFWEEGSPDERIVGGGSYTDMPITSLWYPSDHSQYILDWKTPRECEYNIPVDDWTLLQGASPNAPGVLLASYNFDQDAVRLGNMDELLRLESIKQQVEKVNGLSEDYLNSILKNYRTIHWNSEEWFRGAFCYFSPEQKRLFSYVMVKPEYNNRVFFAGEHTSPKHGWIQGALQTGMKAANSLAYYCRLQG